MVFSLFHVGWVLITAVLFFTKMTDSNLIQSSGEINAFNYFEPLPVSDITDDREEEAEPELELPVIDCGSKFAKVLSLSLDPPCGGDGSARPCVLERGQEYRLNSTFLPFIYSKNLTLQINQVDANFGFDTQLHPPKSLCGKYDVECPVPEDIPVDSLFTGKFPNSLPPFKIIVRVIIYGDDKNVLLCKQLPLDVK